MDVGSGIRRAAHKPAEGKVRVCEMSHHLCQTSASACREAKHVVISRCVACLTTSDPTIVQCKHYSWDKSLYSRSSLASPLAILPAANHIGHEFAKD
jgi:hypothetical protein